MSLVGDKTISPEYSYVFHILGVNAISKYLLCEIVHCIVGSNTESCSPCKRISKVTPATQRIWDLATSFLLQYIVELEKRHFISPCDDMDFTKFFAQKTNYRKVDMIRHLSKRILHFCSLQSKWNLKNDCKRIIFWFSAKLYFQKPDSIFLAAGMPNSNFFPFTSFSTVLRGKEITLSSREVTEALQYVASQG